MQAQDRQRLILKDILRICITDESCQLSLIQHAQLLGQYVQCHDVFMRIDTAERISVMIGDIEGFPVPSTFFGLCDTEAPHGILDLFISCRQIQPYLRVIRKPVQSDREYRILCFHGKLRSSYVSHFDELLISSDLFDISGDLFCIPYGTEEFIRILLQHADPVLYICHMLLAVPIIIRKAQILHQEGRTDLCPQFLLCIGFAAKHP